VAPAVIVAAAVVILIAIRPVEDSSTVRTTTSAGDPTGSGSAAATSRPDAGTVSLGASSVRVPVQVAGFGPAEVWSAPSSQSADGGGATYHVLGPIEGVFEGWLSVDVRSDPALHRALTAHDTEAALELLGHGDLDAQFVPAGRWEVLSVNRTGATPDADTGLPDRAYDDWLFAVGGDQIVQVSSDQLDGSEMLAFIARIEGPTP
jgi:hypothetical protein